MIAATVIFILTRATPAFAFADVLKNVQQAHSVSYNGSGVVKLPNVPGSLCDFLDTFRRERVNLSRLLSRPIRGCPREYAFLVDLESGRADANVRRALPAARKTCTELRVVGSYASGRVYSS